MSAPTKGLSLVGFMQRDAAIDHLRNSCVPAIDTDPVLEAEWLKAQALLGPAIAKVGLPDIQPMPASHNGYEATLKNGVFAPNFTQPSLLNATVKMVEIDPILAFQFSIDSDRSDYHCSKLSLPPTMDEMLALCLPLTPTNENFRVHTQQNSLIVKSKSLNLVTQAQGYFPPTFAGIAFGVSLPFSHVVKYNGRCYLHNGFHRALGLRKAGATHMPCILRDVPDPLSVGIRAGGTFDVQLLESTNPPTVAHFTGGRAWPVDLRPSSRILTISWSEHVVYDDG